MLSYFISILIVGAVFLLGCRVGASRVALMAFHMGCHFDTFKSQMDKDPESFETHKLCVGNWWVGTHEVYSKPKDSSPEN